MYAASSDVCHRMLNDSRVGIRSTGLYNTNMASDNTYELMRDVHGAIMQIDEKMSLDEAFDMSKGAVYALSTSPSPQCTSLVMEAIRHLLVLPFAHELPLERLIGTLFDVSLDVPPLDVVVRIQERIASTPGLPDCLKKYEDVISRSLTLMHDVLLTAQDSFDRGLRFSHAFTCFIHGCVLRYFGHPGSVARNDDILILDALIDGIWSFIESGRKNDIVEKNMRAYLLSLPERLDDIGRHRAHVLTEFFVKLTMHGRREDIEIVQELAIEGLLDRIMATYIVNRDVYTKFLEMAQYEASANRNGISERWVIAPRVIDMFPELSERLGSEMNKLDLPMM